MNKIIIAVLLLIASTQVQAANASGSAMFARCAGWANASNLVGKLNLFKKAYFILEQGEGSQVTYAFSWGVAEGLVLGSGSNASTYYYAVCASREQYARDLIAQTKT